MTGALDQEAAVVPEPDQRFADPTTYERWDRQLTEGTADGWVAGESEAVMDDIRWVRTRYTIDPKRVIAHGQGVGGQMAYYLAINHKEVIRGACPVVVVCSGLSFMAQIVNAISPTKKNAVKTRIV